MEVVINKHGLVAAPVTPQLFGNAGKEHMEKYGEIYLCNSLYVHVNSRYLNCLSNNLYNDCKVPKVRPHKSSDSALLLLHL